MIGRFNAIYGGSLFYILGTTLLVATTYNYPAAYALSISAKEGFLALSLILIAIGTGGIKANVSPFGADQFKGRGPETLQKFFNWFFFFIMIGALLAFTVVSYIQQEISFFYGYLISAFSMVLAITILLIGKKHYVVQPLRGNYLAETFRIVGRGLKDKLCCKKPVGFTHWLDGAKLSNGGKFADDVVEGVKSVVRLMPIFLTFIFYWTVLSQVKSALLLSYCDISGDKITGLEFALVHTCDITT